MKRLAELFNLSRYQKCDHCKMSIDMWKITRENICVDYSSINNNERKKAVTEFDTVKLSMKGKLYIHCNRCAKNEVFMNTRKKRVA